MKNDVDQFQGKVSELLIRHRSIMDSLTKFHESTARINRAIAKTVTSCGCLSVCASKQNCPPEVDLKDCQKYMDSHLQGELCEQCREAVEEELGNHLFYLAAICDLLDLELTDVFGKEFKRISTLGFFNLS
ncbi:nucleoside triphosphate pyrophosphohydrolase family protein [Dethiobacter alkaliphilus]|uniref:DUF1573 domain-containing protein n=1 Tax=Dethiobacter alkaliphilus TaxID=427926 RepID=UPI002227E39B|nr:DUF1573 domain-containing protein [Dethiobacter alkaliphilus]MCW3491051.1 DUF1573 domain-containing protein [Dethiobacter alkaliphilus]